MEQHHVPTGPINDVYPDTAPGINSVDYCDYVLSVSSETCPSVLARLFGVLQTLSLVPLSVNSDRSSTTTILTVIALPWFIDHYLTEETTPEMIVRAIDITVELVGIDHVGLSSDDTYCWTSMWEIAAKHPEWWQDDGQTQEAAKNKPSGAAEPAKIYPAIVDLLWKKGYSNEDVSKVLGGNLMRVYKQVWD